MESVYSIISFCFEYDAFLSQFLKFLICVGATVIKKFCLFFIKLIIIFVLKLDIKRKQYFIAVLIISHRSSWKRYKYHNFYHTASNRSVLIYSVNPIAGMIRDGSMSGCP